MYNNYNYILTVYSHEKIQANPSKSIFVLFHSDWCPDCVEGDPIVLEVLKERADCVLVQCDVGDVAGYKSPQHPYRTHAQIKLTAIPTLMRWKTVCDIERLMFS